MEGELSGSLLYPVDAHLLPEQIVLLRRRQSETKRGRRKTIAAAEIVPIRRDNGKGERLQNLLRP